MPDTARQNTYRKAKKPGLDDVSYTNPLYNTSMIIKGVADKFAQITGRSNNDKGKKKK
jgi:hypothetical protein